MRPRELTVRGFRSYADETSFGWDDRSLVGVVGPIGSGKTSILDAISFALYGKTPRVERDTKSLINQRRDAMHVSLTFDVDGETWKAVRTLRRGGASAHALYRLEDGAEMEVTDRAREMGERIESLLGLDFDAFRRSVLLAQNQFAGFLEATATERNQVLKGVFGFELLDEMRTIAKERLDGLTGRLAVLSDRRQTAGADRAELDKRRTDLEAAEARSAALEELRAPFEEMKEMIGESDAKAADAEKRASRLGDMADRIPDPDDTDELFARAEKSGGGVAATEEELSAAEQRRIDAAEALEERLAAIGGRAGLGEAGDLVGAWRSAREQAGRSASGEEVARKAAEAAVCTASEATLAQAESLAAAEAAAVSESESRTAVERARDSLRRVLQDHRAHAVRADLVVGEPCPVCSRPVKEIPEIEAPAAVDTAERAVADGEQEAERLGEASLRAATEAAQSGTAAAAAEEARINAAQTATGAGEAAERDRTALDEAAAAVAALLGEGDPEQRLAELRTAVEAAESTLSETTSTEQEARAALEEARAVAAAAVAALASLRTELATLIGALDVSAEVAESPESLRSALVAVGEAWIGQMRAAKEDLERATEKAEAAGVARRDLLEGAGLVESDDIVDVISGARAEATGLAGMVEVLEKRLADLERLDAGEAELISASETLTRLHSDLAPSRFLEFVLDVRRRALGELASEHLEVLTAGRYRFDDSGDLLVVDLNAADAVRSPTSLSGGETFLASLALALALAEIVAREGGRLDAFFLDEGFGSLDPEHIDLAMDGIERLVTTGPERLVVVVSHVPALRDRIEDLVQLDRDPITGDTRVVSGAS